MSESDREEPGVNPPSSEGGDRSYPRTSESGHPAPSTEHRNSEPRNSEHRAPSTEHRNSEHRAPSTEHRNSEHRAPSTEHYQEDDEISLLDIAIVLAKHKKLILGLPLLAALITAGITLLMPNIYTGRAVLMPPQQQQSTAAMMLGQLGALAGAAGGSLGLKNPNDLYVGMLKSRTVADAVIEQFKLQALYEKETMVETRKALADNTSVTSGKDGLIVIEVDDEDPQRAADMANAYVVELEKLTSNLAVTEAGQRRLFFEKQLIEAKEDLAKAEVALKETQEETGLVQLDQQGRALIEAVATLRAQIVVREVELAAMRSFATENNPEFIKVQQEVASLRAELRKLERGTGTGGDMLVPTRNIPAAGLAYARKFRDVKYAETIFELMAKQFELAKMDEAREAAVIQVVDAAVIPDFKSKPHRALMVVLAGMLAGLLSMVVAYLLDMRKRAKGDPMQERLVQELSQHLPRWGRQ
jgi:tyrosine-protein kinase Etk/Wzc